MCTPIKLHDGAGAQAMGAGGVAAAASAWRGHLCFREHVRASLQRQAGGQAGIMLRWLPTTGVARSAVQVELPDRPPVLLLLSGQV